MKNILLFILLLNVKIIFAQIDDEIKGYKNLKFGKKKSSITKKLQKENIPFDTTVTKKGTFYVRDFLLKKGRAIKFKRNNVIKNNNYNLSDEYQPEVYIYFNDQNKFYRAEEIIHGASKNLNDAIDNFNLIFNSLKGKYGDNFLLEDNLDSVKFSSQHPPKTKIYKWVKKDGYVILSFFTGSFFQLDDNFIYSDTPNENGLLEVTINYVSTNFNVNSEKIN